MRLFAHLQGNERAKKTLTRLLENGEIPHTLLFYGPEGVGKRQFARAFARAQLKTTKECPPDLFELTPEGKADLITVEKVQFLLRDSEKPPFEATSKWFILDEADRLHPAAANALLKRLEEPLSTTHFILITSNKYALLPTVVSRCHPLLFGPVIDPNFPPMAQGSFSRAALLSNDLTELIQKYLQTQDPIEIETFSGEIEEALTIDKTFDLKRFDLFLDELFHYSRLSCPEQDLDKLHQKIEFINEGIKRHIKLRNLLASVAYT